MKSVTLDIDIDEEAIDEVVSVDWHGVENGQIVGNAEVDVEAVIKEVVTGVGLVESKTSAEIAIAIEQVIGKPVWEKNLKETISDEDELVELDK